MNAVIVIGKNVSPKLAKARCKGAFVFGADQGAEYCIEHGIRVDIAVGDFDSVTPEAKAKIAQNSARFIELPPHKDMTDTAHALFLCGDNFPSITILGGIAGNRIEHFVANVDLLRAHPNKLFLEDDDSLCFALSKSTVAVTKAECEYVSLFALEEATVTATGFEYPLTSATLTVGNPIGVSNQLRDEQGSIHVERGLVLVIYHRRKH